MSLLWVQAARHLALPWHNDQIEYENEEHYRQPGSYEERRPHYVQQIAERHGVPHQKASEALSEIEWRLHDHRIFAHPTDIGFDSVREPDPHVMAKLQDARTWDRAHDDEISTHAPIHATQDFVQLHRLAHNLFHPGVHTPDQDDFVGDPDYPAHEDHEYRTEHPEEFEGADSLEPRHQHSRHSGHVRAYVDEQGHQFVMDGHHRAGTDLLLGKEHIPARVLYDEDLPT